ncbi:MAG: RNA methyltransferase [Cytophagales bacterium]|nr:RNA methyltransferase [Cytophagales bacterium]
MQEKSKKNNPVKESAEHLSGFITENKKERIGQALGNRTRYITVVLEGIFQPHNASAVIRSCDCFGIQDVHVIENQNEFKVNTNVALGASKWVDVIRSGSSSGTKECIEKLRDQGYRIIATAPYCEVRSTKYPAKNDGAGKVRSKKKKVYDLDDFPLDKGKIALFFGTEMDGLSGEALKNADEFLKIPMYGFTESLNISVCVAICLHHLTINLHGSELKWRLSEKEKNEIRLKWIRRIIKGKTA